VADLELEMPLTMAIRAAAVALLQGDSDPTASYHSPGKAVTALCEAE
jgi:hypothetical protein